MEIWKVVTLCLLALFVYITVLMLIDVKEKLRRKKHPVWYEHYDRAVSNSFIIGTHFQGMVVTLDTRRDMIQGMFLNGECTADECNEALKAITKDLEEACKWYEINKEVLGIDADLRAADAYAREHNLKWGIVYNG